MVKNFRYLNYLKYFKYATTEYVELKNQMFQNLCVFLSIKVYVQVFSCCQLPVPPVRLQRAVKVKTPLDWGEKARVFSCEAVRCGSVVAQQQADISCGVSGMKQQD